MTRTLNCLMPSHSLKRILTAVVAALAAVISSYRTAAATVEQATPRHPAKEDTYTITSTIEVVNPIDPDVMNDDFQVVRVIKRDADEYTLEVTYYPLFQPTIGENPHWREDDAGMTEYLRSTPTENWDERMRQDLLADLGHAGIHPDQLTDKQLVERVSRWAMRRARTTQAFAIWAVYFPHAKPSVFPALRSAFDREKRIGNWTDEQMFDQEVLGRSMYYNNIHGACTSTSIYLATILRPLGIPTRIVICIPPFDPNVGRAWDWLAHKELGFPVLQELDCLIVGHEVVVDALEGDVVDFGLHHCVPDRQDKQVVDRVRPA
jgi:hypothetical protein